MMRPGGSSQGGGAYIRYSERSGRGCVDQIFTLKQIGEKAKENKCRVYVGFMDLEKAYDRVNR